MMKHNLWAESPHHQVLVEQTRTLFARKMARELGCDLNLNQDSRGVILSHVYNTLCDPLLELLQRAKRKEGA